MIAERRDARTLTENERQDLCRRYFNRIESGETVQQIGDSLGISRRSVPVIARRQKERAPLIAASQTEP